jgi:hypothetical protein
MCHHHPGQPQSDICGGGNGAMAEIDRVIRDGPCWHDAVARATAQIAR